MLAVQNGHRACAERLLSAGARVNTKPPGYHWRGTALHAAVWHGEVGMVEWLLDRGADPAVRDDHVDADAAGWAKHHGRHAVVALLAAR